MGWAHGPRRPCGRREPTAARHRPPPPPPPAPRAPGPEPAPLGHPPPETRYLGALTETACPAALTPPAPASRARAARVPAARSTLRLPGARPAGCPGRPAACAARKPAAPVSG